MEYMGVANSNLMFWLCLIPIVMVVLMAVIFMKVAWNEGKHLGLTAAEMKNIIMSSAVFSIVPSIAVLFMLMGLTFMLGKYFPWLRLSVIGSGIYETMAANMALSSFGLQDFAGASLTDFAGVMMIMTAGILVGPVLNICFLKKYDSVIKGASGGGGKFVPFLIDAMFIGILVEWLAPGLMDFENIHGILAMAVGLISMLVFTLLEKTAWGKRMENFSMSISMIAGMLAAILFSLAAGR